MKERPILMSGAMVRAILEGRKTQTRRIITSRKQEHFGIIQDVLSSALDIEANKIGGWRISGDSPTCYDGEVQMNDWSTEIECPYGVSGDRLWVKETFAYSVGESVPDGGKVEMRAYRSDFGDDATCPVGKWKPSIFMHRALSRVTLEITDVRVERLQDISEADAFAEGIDEEGEAYSKAEHFQLGGSNIRGGTPAVFAYADLWESINGEGSWAANPYVWVLTFRRIQP